MSTFCAQVKAFAQEFRLNMQEVTRPDLEEEFRLNMQEVTRPDLEERVARAASPLFTEEDWDKIEFTQLVTYCKARLSGENVRILCSLEAFTVRPEEFMRSLKTMHESGRNPLTIAEFNSFKE